MIRLLFAIVVFLGSLSVYAYWEKEKVTPNGSDFGGIGLMQTPTARFAKDGMLTVGCSSVSPYNRCFLNVQALPWLEGTFRYTEITNKLYGPRSLSGDQTYKDKGVDFRVRLLSETRNIPQLAIGFRDIGGTGLFASEFLVASKRYYNWDFSLGLGWGNLGSRRHVSNPLKYISKSFSDRNKSGGIRGGELTGNYFAGEKTSVFGGIEYLTWIQGLRVKLEYDGNSYMQEPLGNLLEVKSPINVAVNYRLWDFVDLSIGLERGNTMMLAFAVPLDLHASLLPKFDPKPEKVLPRSSLLNTYASQQEQADTVINALIKKDYTVEGVDLAPPLITAYVTQGKFREQPRASGRASRIIANLLTPEFEHIRVVEDRGGLQINAITTARKDLEMAETKKVSLDEMWYRASITGPESSYPNSLVYNERRYPNFGWGVSPNIRQHIGGPDDFYLWQLYVTLGGSIAFSRGLTLTGSLGLDVANSFDKLKYKAGSGLPRVRSDIKEYLIEGKNGISRLELDYLWNPAKDWYARLTAGLLEEMYGGISGEILYRKFGSRFAIGADLNWVKQRGFEKLFSFRNYDVVTGHVTASYDIPFYDLKATMSVGRYLAKDIGTTIELARRFKNGVHIGAFASFTDVPAEVFGEGGFDKGFFISVPLDLFFIKSKRRFSNFSFRPLTRDGGQKLVVGKRLFGATYAGGYNAIARDWNSFLE